MSIGNRQQLDALADQGFTFSLSHGAGELRAIRAQQADTPAALCSLGAACFSAQRVHPRPPPITVAGGNRDLGRQSILGSLPGQFHRGGKLGCLS